MGRPPVQHIKHVHLIEVDEDVLDRIERVAVVQAVGKASAGFLSNPMNGILILTAALGITAGVAGADGVNRVIDLFTSIQEMFNAEGPGDKSAAASDLQNAMRAVIEFFSPLGKFTPTP